MKKALIIVDLQRDFCPGGALPAAGGNGIVPVINKLMQSFDLVIASKDWHPARTVHFDRWPPHCIRGSEGAAFHPELNIGRIDEVALKGTGNSDDGYSAFEATNLDLAYVLEKQGIAEVYVSGLTTEYCAKATALDALKAGFKTFVITDAIAAVNQQPGDDAKALSGMQAAGILLLQSSGISPSENN